MAQPIIPGCFAIVAHDCAPKGLANAAQPGKVLGAQPGDLLDVGFVVTPEDDNSAGWAYARLCFGVVSEGWVPLEVLQRVTTLDEYWSAKNWPRLYQSVVADGAGSAEAGAECAGAVAYGAGCAGSPDAASASAGAACAGSPTLSRLQGTDAQRHSGCDSLNGGHRKRTRWNRAEIPQSQWERALSVDEDLALALANPVELKLVEKNRLAWPITKKLELPQDTESWMQTAWIWAYPTECCIGVDYFELSDDVWPWYLDEDLPAARLFRFLERKEMASHDRDVWCAEKS